MPNLRGATQFPSDPLNSASIASTPGISNTLLASFNFPSVVLYSQDGGSSWQPLPNIPWKETPNILQVAIAPRDDPKASARFLVAVESANPDEIGVYRSGDKGLTWTFMPFPALEFCNLPGGFSAFISSPVDPKRLYLVRYCSSTIPGGLVPIGDYYYSVFTSSDAGVNWQQVQQWQLGEARLMLSPQLSERIYLYESDNSHPGLLQSDNAGRDWIEKSFPYEFAIDAQDSSRLYGLDYTGTTIIGKRSIDGGATWSDLGELPCSSPYVKDFLADPTLSNILYIRCNQGLFRSSDGGEHWRKLSDWKGQWIGADYGTLGRLLWARDDGLWATRDQGTTWTHLSDNYQADLVQPWHNASPPDGVGQINSVTPLSSTSAWAVGENGVILNWQGDEWTKITSPVTTSLSSSAFVSPTDGWAIGEQAILHWNGDTWISVSKPITNALRVVAAVAADDAWAVGDAGAMLHWQGKTWEVISSTTTLQLRAIAMRTPTDGWAVGGSTLDTEPASMQGVILHWNGERWSKYAEPKYTLMAIAMVSPNDGWIVGGVPGDEEKSKILHWNGVVWQEVIHPLGSLLTAVTMATATEGWAVGINGPPFFQQPVNLYWDGKQWTQDITDDRTWQSVVMLPSRATWFVAGDTIALYQPVFNIYLPWTQK